MENKNDGILSLICKENMYYNELSLESILEVLDYLFDEWERNNDIL